MNRGWVLAVLGSLVWAGPVLAQGPTTRDVTFFATSDCHYVEPTRKNNRNESNRNTIDEMNRITEAKWPAVLGGDAVHAPRGVCVLGDCIDDGDKVVQGTNVSEQQYKFFVADFGLDGTDGRLKFPVFEGWGNHDGPPIGKETHGFSFQAHLKARNQSRLSHGRISNLSSNGLHYSWDWDDVHFVQLNIYPADRQSEGARYSAVWHNPQGALEFLKQDLAEKVGTSGRPVVLMSHCGFDTDWWFPVDWRAVYDAVKPYNLVLYVYGHTGTGVRPWAPAGETKKWLCINDGQTEKGFFVIQLQGDRLRAAMRRKSNYVVTKGADGSITSHSDGQWEWKWEVDR
ncbi:MAG TPA: metallophosphoesterase, partial [Tepidisphaeraceae bacterium]|nr:metallophosphoesterase [Tepidisphaeraceae bacterium]